ncbi:hypothetical protein [Geodermatophilus sp. SYSU D01036]
MLEHFWTVIGIAAGVGFIGLLIGGPRWAMGFFNVTALIGWIWVLVS